MLKVKILDFAMPPFVRITWVSQKARDVWESRINSIKQALDKLEYHMITSGVYSLLLKRVYYHEVESLRPRVKALGLNIERIDVPVSDISFFYSHDMPEDKKRAFVLIGEEEKNEQAVFCLKNKDFYGFHSCFGVPDCCVDSLYRIKCSNCTSPLWSILFSIDKTKKYIDGSLNSNVFWEALGLKITSHYPCSIDCRKSINIAEGIIRLGEKLGYYKEMEWLNDILTWPISWSCLHGVAEIASPVMKIITNFQATADKYLININGKNYPKNGASGISFPYKKKLSYECSKSKQYQGYSERRERRNVCK